MNKIELLRDLISKSTDETERKGYEDQLVEAIQADAKEKADAEVEAKVREELAKAQKENIADPEEVTAEGTVIKMGTGDEYKGVKIKKVMALMAEKAKGQGAVDYLKAEPESAEFVARFWIDKGLGAHEKANELITTTDNVGGYLTPTEQESAILDYVKYTSLALRDATVIPMNSDVMTVPAVGTSPSVTIESGETTITQATPTFGVATLTSKRHSGYIPVSWEMEADNTAGLIAYLADKFYEDLGVTIDSAVFCGPGSLVDGSGVMVGYGLSSVMASGSTNFSSVYTAAAIATEAKIYPERLTGAKVYAGYASAVPYLKQLLFGTDNNIYDWHDGTFMGYPVEKLRTSPATGVSKPVFVLGNLKNFMIGSRLMNTQLKRIENKTGLTDYVFFTRLAYSNPLSSAFVACQTAAS